ncbi:quinone oxidoreductase [Planoprotostelium fungivorum]|uniref:Probable quinone oxidoreductase n=1 Tax=Planoprotostelium fungivorum TaxID=1890364 RepID=A0A2P6NHP4_9EUKA|nr:quinone oxidoreductase [Planoprotostelium fungivorum]
MMRAIRLHQVGGPEVLRMEHVAVPKPSVGQLLVRNTVIGVNYIDTYHRTGAYPMPLPATIGRDGAGIVEEVGMGETFGFKKGDRVAYCSTPSGSYAELSTVNAAQTVLVPPHLDDEHACAAMIQGLTAHAFVKGAYHVKEGSKVLVHAAAGGLGRLLVQCSKKLGAYVIGTTSTEEKKEIALAAGCDEVILYSEKNFVEETKRITMGRGVDVVYDSVGKDTLLGSLDCLTRRGCLVACGNASGKPAPLELGLLSAKGSLSVTRPTLNDFIVTRPEFEERVNEVFRWIQEDKMKLKVMQPIFKLEDAQEAHRFIEARKSVGKVLMRLE